MSTLTPFADMAPVPRVLVDVPVSEYPAGAATISLTRTAEGRTFAVRGGQSLPATSPAIVLDAEAPFGVQSAYSVVGYDGLGSIVGSRPLGTVTLQFDACVVQQPLDPRLSVAVVRLEGTGNELRRSTPGDPIYPQGRAVPSLIGLGPRRGVEGLSLELFVSDYGAADMLQATLGTYETPQLPIWLVRTPPDQRLPRVFFCHVPNVVEKPVFGTADPEAVRFSAVVTEVAPPAVGITATVLTHSDMKVFFATHTAVKAQYVTHSDIKRDTSLIGAADA